MNELSRLKAKVRRLEDENASLEYWAEMHWRWASGHCAERMADYKRHCEELRRVMKIREFDPGRYRRLIKRETRKMVAGWRKKR